MGWLMIDVFRDAYQRASFSCPQVSFRIISTPFFFFIFRLTLAYFLFSFSIMYDFHIIIRHRLPTLFSFGLRFIICHTMLPSLCHLRYFLLSFFAFQQEHEYFIVFDISARLRKAKLRIAPSVASADLLSQSASSLSILIVPYDDDCRSVFHILLGYITDDWWHFAFYLLLAAFS